ncbi:SUR7/PalI family-domain-containing protein [Mycena albidolilacea]|uniref:SUR7/PalI family-domain-containing protein n=1 Tax=Mycena albidolilacea TaxID=1033008 RepID=A0AAD7F061_9AGAR|nr:SUR7/PalI family-domain-containing protein [Mycena albidolilacea]
MGCIRPATPGFILTTLATALLAVVSFCVPYFKSVYFLKADLSVSGVSGSITFGTLGYCVELNNGTTCSKPSVGYELDINGLVGNDLPIQIPNVVVKWLTYVLVLHIVALALAAGSAVFGLLAHLREMAMTCCSTCISGFAAAVALIAFIFDLAFFFLAKSRINSVGSASIGNAIWLTLAAWILLFFSGCFYTVGRCCMSKRQKRGDWDRRQEPPPPGASDQMRLDAVKAEADRKARQKASEGGLPAFHESQPLTSAAYDDHGNLYTDKPPTPGGYMQAPLGTRAVDQYYNNNAGPAGYNNASAAYPPSPHGQQRQYAPSAYAPSTYSYNAPQQSTAYPPQQYQSTPPLQHSMSPPQQFHSTLPPDRIMSPPQQYAAVGAVGAMHTGQQPNPYLDPAPNNQYLGVGGHAPRDASNPYLGVAGHAQRDTSYHSAATHHGGDYSQYDPYDDAGAQQPASAYYTPQTQYPQSSYNSSPHQQPQSQYSPQAESRPQTQYRAEAPRGDGYGANSVPPLDTGGYFPYTHGQDQKAAASSSASTVPTSPTSPKGPRNHRQSLHAMNHDEEESPPQYDAGASEHIPGAWGKN